ncbi:hypothetical protein HDU76_001922, partial [Blyttiomyces sp. JEL0837]
MLHHFKFTTILTVVAAAATLVDVLGCPDNGSKPSDLDRCVCNPGFFWNDQANPAFCQQGPNKGGADGCPLHGHKDSCLNRCVCDSGFWWDGSECASGPNNLGPNGCPYKSTGTPGNCHCNSGYFWDGTSCAQGTANNNCGGGGGGGSGGSGGSSGGSWNPILIKGGSKAL